MLKPVSRFVSFILGTKFIRFFGKRIITSYKAFMPDGSLMFVKSNDESMPYMADEIYNQHVYDTVFEISEGQTVVDVGANVGMFTVRAAKKVGDHGRVISIEPSQTNYELLSRNIKEHACRNVTALNLAAGSEKHKREFYVYINHGNSSFVKRDNETVETRQVVEMTTLDDVLDSLGIQEVDVIKIDVEGWELEVLKGAAKSLHHHPNIVLETHPFGPAPEAITAFLDQFGYQATWTIDANGLGMLYAHANVRESGSA